VTGLFEILGILGFSFALNIIPFAGPSNLLIASNAAIFVDIDPTTIGFLVALGSATAKFIHYIVTFYLGKFVNEKRRKGLDAAGQKLRKWAPVAIFAAAATPIPDEPVIVPLGLIRYNPAKLFTAFFLGKLLITIIGAHMGKFTQDFFEGAIGQVVLPVISIVLTIAITVILLKIDVDKTIDRILKRKIKPTPV
jgi:membrane protein YqaA with SNARE-associated domain